LQTLKIQFHIHSKSDPEDTLKQTEYDIINTAKKYNYDAIAITCHNKLVWNENLFKYAKKQGILLIKGIEKEIENNHIVIINADKNAEQIKTYKDLENYKNTHPNTLTIAAHPYYPGKVSIKNKLKKYIHIIDAIEYSYFYTKHINFPNKKAQQFAKQNNIPIIGTSDNHILKYFNKTHTTIKAEKNITSIIQSIKQNKIKIHSTPLTLIEFFIKIPLQMLLITFLPNKNKKM